MFNRMFLDGVISWDEENMKKMYLNWIEHVKRVVPKDQLLIFNVKEGWEPLCKFLDVPGWCIMLMKSNYSPSPFSRLTESKS